MARTKQDPCCRWLGAALLFVCAVAPAARADDDDLVESHIVDEIAAGATSPTSTAPRSGFVSDSLAVNLALSAAWRLRATASFTRDVSASAPSSASFASQGGNVAAFGLGGTYVPSPAWILALELDGSPKSTTLAPTTVSAENLRGDPIDVNAQLEASTSSLGATAAVRWHVKDDAPVATELGLDATVTQFTTAQSISAFRTPDGMTITAAQASAFCRAHPKTCPPAELAVIEGASAHLVEVRLAATVTATFAEDTDVGLTAGYFLYTKDPTTAGYYTLTSLGRQHRSQKLGAGVPIAPEQLSVELDGVHRFGRIEASLGLDYTRYVSDQGYTLSADGQGTVHFGEAWSVWLGLGGERDVDVEGSAQRSVQATLGGVRRF